MITSIYQEPFVRLSSLETNLQFCIMTSSNAAVVSVNFWAHNLRLSGVC